MSIRLPRPHQGIVKVRSEAANENILVASRRWRKTTMCMSIAVETAANGLPFLWTAPTFSQVDVGWDESRKACDAVAEFNRTRMTATFPGGGRIFYRSLDKPDSTRGLTAAGAVIDEAQGVEGEAIDAVVRPVLFDMRGFLWQIGTPNGPGHFQDSYERCLAGWREGKPTRAWRAPAVGAEIDADGVLVRVPHPLENDDLVSQGYFGDLQTIYERVPERIFRQEYLAEFVMDGSGAFRNVEACSVATPQEKAIPGHRYALGVDFAKVNDFTSIKVIDATTNEHVAGTRFNMLEYRFQVGRLKAMCERFPPDVIVAEANAMGEPMVEHLLAEGLPVLPFHTNNASKAEIIEGLGLAFERERIKILPKALDPNLRLELDAFKPSRTESGLIKYGAPEGKHDDDVMALALAWYGAESGRVSYLPSFL